VNLALREKPSSRVVVELLSKIDLLFLKGIAGARLNLLNN
jgi:hypothetical protein